MTKIPQDKQYDGEAITLPEGLVKIYSDKDVKEIALYCKRIQKKLINSLACFDICLQLWCNCDITLCWIMIWQLLWQTAIMLPTILHH